MLPPRVGAHMAFRRNSRQHLWTNHCRPVRLCKPDAASIHVCLCRVGVYSLQAGCGGEADQIRQKLTGERQWTVQ